MGKKSACSEPQPPIVVAVVEDFIKRLKADASVDPVAIARLRKALIDEQETSVDALKAALFSEEAL